MVHASSVSRHGTPGDGGIDLDPAAAEIKLRAVRRLGEISKTLPKAHKTGQGTNVQLPATGKLKCDTLKDAGISTSMA